MDGTEERKDSSPSGDSPSEPKGTSETPQTYTEDTQKKAIEDALSAAGREAKTIADMKVEAKGILETAQSVRVKVKEERDLWQEHRDEAERVAVHDDADALKSVNERIRQRTEKANLAKERTELSERETKVTASEKKESDSTKERNAREIATRLGVDPKLLAKLAKLTDGSNEAIEAEAKGLPKVGDPKPSLKTDSGVTVGAGGSPKTGKAKMRSGWDTVHKT